MKTCCGNLTLQKVSRGVLATARQFGQYYAVREDLPRGERWQGRALWPELCDLVRHIRIAANDAEINVGFHRMSPTPILDRQQAAPAQPPVKQARYLAIGAALGVVLLFISGNSSFTPLPDLAVFLAGLYSGVLLHELGHLAAGIAVGFDFRQILAGPFVLTRGLLGYSLRFVPNHILPSGHTLMVARSPEHLRRRFSVFAAGGPLATALLFLPIVLLPWGPLTVAPLLANLVLAFLSWVPLEVSGSYSDVKVIQVLSRRGPAAERLAAILYLTALDGCGIEPSQWPSQVVANLAAPEGARAYRAVSRIFLHVYAQETAPAAEIATALEQALALAAEMRADLRRIYFAEAAFWQGLINRNAVLARAWLNDAHAVKGAVAQKDWDAASLAAIAIVEGDRLQFRDYLNRALAFLDCQPGPSGCVSASRARLLKIGQELQNEHWDAIPRGR